MGQAAAASARADGRSGEIAWRGIETDRLRDDWNQERLIRSAEKYDVAEIEGQKWTMGPRPRGEFLIKNLRQIGTKNCWKYEVHKRKKHEELCTNSDSCVGAAAHGVRPD